MVHKFQRSTFRASFPSAFGNWWWPMSTWRASVAKRVDVYAVALHHAVTVAEVSDLDLSYAPPLGSPYDAVQVAAHAWTLAARTAATIG